MSNLLWVDIFKGIGIVFVVIGHIYIGDISKYIYLFHMPLFFFIGGYLFNIKQDQKIYLKNKVKHLIVPYLSFLFILFFIPLFLKILLVPDFTITVFLKDSVKGIIGGRFLGGITGVFWFVTVFFFTQQFMNYLLRRFSLNQTAAIVLIMVVFSYINSFYFKEYWLPLNLNVVLAAIPLFFIGYVVKLYNIKMNTSVIMMVSLLSVLSLYFGYHNTYDMKYSDYGIPFVTLFSSLSFIFIFISKIMASTRFLAPLFKELGLAFMLIMYLHQPIQITFNYLNILDGSKSIRLLAALIISYLIYLIFQRYTYTSIYLLGQNTNKKSHTYV